MLRAIARLQSAPAARSASFSTLRLTAPKAAASTHSARCRCSNCSSHHPPGCSCARCSAGQTRGFAVRSQAKYDIPKTQKAIVMEEHGEQLKVRNDWPVVQPDELKPGELLVRLAYTGVCHSDLHAWKGDWPLPTKLPLVGGHEGTGYVAAIGKHTQTNLKVGDAVGVKWLAKSCLGCEDCRKGHESTCPDQSVHGYTIDGSFQQWCVSYADHVTPIPSEVPMPEAAPILCAGVTVYKALKEFGGICGETVVIPGAGGGLGHLACQYARAMGYRVIAIDSGEDKRQLVASYGVKDFIDFKDGNVTEKVMALTGGFGAHGVVVVAGGGNPYADALSFIRAHGTVVLVGVPADSELKPDVFTTVLRAHRIIGSVVGNRQDAVEALKLVGNGDVHTKYSIEKLDNLPSVFERMEAGKLQGRIVLDCE